MFAVIRRLFRPLEFTGRGGYLELCKIAYPLVILSASNTVMQFVDRMFLSSLSPTDVGAAMVAGITYFSLFCVFLCTVGFTSAIVAQYHGAGDRKMVLTSVWSGAYFGLGAAAVIVCALPYLGERAILWLSQVLDYEPELTIRIRYYYLAMIPSGAFACVASPFFAFFSGRGKTVPVAVINIFACLMNIVLDYVFIFGWWIIPESGIFGAGIATSLCSMLSMVLGIGYFLLQNQREYPTRSQRTPEWSCIVRLVRYGIPSGIQVAFDTGAFAVVSITIGHLGSLPLAAHSIALSINNMFFIPLLGLSDATAILVGQYIGRAKHAIAQKVAYRAWRVSICYMMLGGFVYLVFPVMLAEMFSPQQNPEQFKTIVPVIRWLLAIAFCFNLTDTLKFVFAAALRGAGDTRAIMKICLSCAYGLMLPGVMCLIFFFEASVLLIWAYLVFVALTEGIFIVRRFRSGKWRQIRLIRPPEKIRHLDEKTGRYEPANLTD